MTRVDRYNQDRVALRQTDEMIGMIRMALADGALEMFEVQFIVRWMQLHPPVRSMWPGDIIFERLSQSIANGTPYQNHESHLLELLNRYLGSADVEDSTSASSRLPLSDPPPTITTAGRIFCLTGRFNLGQKADCESIIIKMGGEISKGLTRSVDYLVIGEDGSPDWLHAHYGLKIRKAVALNESGGGSIAVVSESHWLQHVPAELKDHAR